MSRRRLFLEYRLAGPIGRNPWRPIGYFDTGRVTVKRPGKGTSYFRARIKTDGRLGLPLVSYFDPLSEPADIPRAAAEKPVPSVQVNADGVLVVSTTIPPGSYNKPRFNTEIRISEKGKTVDEAVEVDVAEPGTETTYNGIASEEVDVHTRAIEVDTDVPDAWTTETVATAASPVAVQDTQEIAGTDTTGMTMVNQHGEATVENEPTAGNGVRLKAMRRMGASGWPLRLGAMTEATGPRWGGMGDFWPSGAFDVDSGDTGAVHDFLPVVDMESHPPEIVPRRLGELRYGFRWNDRYEAADGSTGREVGRNARLGDRNYDQSGMQIREEIAWTLDGTAPAAADLVPVVHGRYYRGRRFLRRFYVETRYGWRRFRVQKFRVIRRIRNRKHEIRTLVTASTMTIVFSTFGIDPFLVAPTVDGNVEWALTAANVTHSVDVKSVTKTQVVVDIKEVTATTLGAITPAANMNLILHILGT